MITNVTDYDYQCDRLLLPMWPIMITNVTDYDYKDDRFTYMTESAQWARSVHVLVVQGDVAAPSQRPVVSTPDIGVYIVKM